MSRRDAGLRADREDRSGRAILSAGVTDVEFELIGDVPLKGVSRSVRLHEATRA